MDWKRCRSKAKVAFAARRRDCDFVIQPAIRVSDHLILVNDEQRRAIAVNEPVLLRFKSSDDYGCLKIFCKVAGLFHPSLWLGYPNEFDRAKAEAEQRFEPKADVNRAEQNLAQLQRVKSSRLNRN